MRKLLPRLKISHDKRYLVDEDGSDFFWLGDTAWELFHRLSKIDAEFYLQTRANQSFNVVQAVVLAEIDGLNVPNAEGNIPLNNNDPEQPNENYFRHVDWVLEKASALGLYVALLPTWGDKVEKKYDWANGPEIFTTANAFNYGFFLGKRYKQQTNIVWILGGDRAPNAITVTIWREMARGILEGTGSAPKHLMSFHPQPFDGGSSSQWFHDDDWLDFNMLQTGHDKHKDTFDLILRDYRRTPTKPVIDGEPLYEAHGLSFKPLENGYSTDHDVRRYAYWSTFSGAFGHSYGCHSVWQFYEGRLGINSPIYSWKEALNLPGARQMDFLKKLMLSKPMADRMPDQGLIGNNQLKSEAYTVAIRDIDGKYAFIYSPAGLPFVVNTLALRGTDLISFWYNPRDGSSTMTSIMAKEKTIEYRPPSTGCDWVLHINSNV